MPEAYLLSAMASDLKGMVKAIFSEFFSFQTRAEYKFRRSWFFLCKQVQFLTVPEGLLADTVLS